MFLETCIFFIGFSIGYFNINIWKTFSDMVSKIINSFYELNSLYVQLLEQETKGDKEKNVTLLHLKVILNCGRFLYNSTFEKLLFVFRKKLFAPIFLQNGKILFPLFVHNETKYVVISSKSEVLKSDICSLNYIVNDESKCISNIEKVFPNILNIYDMEKVTVDDLGLENINIDILNKQFSLETVSFEKGQTILL